MKDPKSLHFKPKNLLKQIISMYLDLNQSEEFCVSVIKDSRSFKLENMTKALRVANKHGILDNTMANNFQFFVQKVKEISKTSIDITVIIFLFYFQGTI